MDNTLDDRPQLPSGVQVVQRDSLILLLHPSAPRWAMVNATGLEVARLCDGQRTVTQIAEDVAALYEIEPGVVLPDVQACLDGLRQAGFLAEPAAPAQSPRDHAWRLHLYLTERCNLRCTHCGVEAGSDRSPETLSGDAIRSLIDEAVALGVDGIAFSGGEPLLRRDTLDLLRYSAERVKTLLSTNGTLIDSVTAAALAELGVIVQISLDGATAEVHDAVRGPGAFERTRAGIAHLQYYGMHEELALNVTLMRHNVHQVAEFVALAAEWGVPGVRFCPLQCMGRAAEQWESLIPNPEEYAEAYRYLYYQQPPGGVTISQGLPGMELEPPEGRMWCGLGRLLLVDSQGDIYPCSLLTTAEFRLGNVAQMTLAEVLAAEPLRALVGLCEGRKDGIEACAACTWRNFCQGSCPGAIWLEHGAWHAVDGFCDLRRELFPGLIFRGRTWEGDSCDGI